MRIVYDIDFPATVSCGAKPYAKMKGKKKSSGFRVDALILAPQHRGDSDADAIYIEGNARYIRDVLAQAIEQIDEAGAYMVERGEIPKNWAEVTKKDRLRR